MHTLYLGVGADFIASSLVAMREHNLLRDWLGPLQEGETEAKKLQALYRVWCRDQALPQLSGLNIFTFNNLGRKSKSAYPVCTSRLKAAPAKQLLVFLQHLTARVCGREDTQDWYPLVVGRWGEHTQHPNKATTCTKNMLRGEGLI